MEHEPPTPGAPSESTASPARRRRRNPPRSAAPEKNAGVDAVAAEQTMADSPTTTPQVIETHPSPADPAQQNSAAQAAAETTDTSLSTETPASSDTTVAGEPTSDTVAQPAAKTAPRRSGSRSSRRRQTNATTTAKTAVAESPTQPTEQVPQDSVPAPVDTPLERPAGVEDTGEGLLAAFLTEQEPTPTSDVPENPEASDTDAASALEDALEDMESDGAVERTDGVASTELTASAGTDTGDGAAIEAEEEADEELDEAGAEEPGDQSTETFDLLDLAEQYAPERERGGRRRRRGRRGGRGGRGTAPNGQDEERVGFEQLSATTDVDESLPPLSLEQPPDATVAEPAAPVEQGQTEESPAAVNFGDRPGRYRTRFSRDAYRFGPPPAPSLAPPISSAATPGLVIPPQPSAQTPTSTSPVPPAIDISVPSAPAALAQTPETPAEPLIPTLPPRPEPVEPDTAASTGQAASTPVAPSPSLTQPPAAESPGRHVSGRHRETLQRHSPPTRQPHGRAARQEAAPSGPPPEQSTQQADSTRPWKDRTPRRPWLAATSGLPASGQTTGSPAASLPTIPAQTLQQRPATLTGTASAVSRQIPAYRPAELPSLTRPAIPAIAPDEYQWLERLLDRQTAAINAIFDRQARLLEAMAGNIHTLRQTVEEISARQQQNENQRVTLPRTGVFVDAPNIYYGADASRVTLDFGRMLAYLSRGRELVHAIAYAPVTDETLGQRYEMQRFVAPFIHKGFKMVTKPLKRFPDGTAKGNFDIELAVDIVTMAERLDIVVLVSGDSDFSRLVELIQSKGVRVEVVAFAANVAPELVYMADVFIDIATRLDDFRLQY